MDLALDDFGTGYSSLSHLRDLPLTTVKVDRSFIVEFGNDTPDTSIVEAIIALGKKLNLCLIAEGVETDEQLEIARDMGFDLIQGWRFARAVPLPQLLNRST